MDASLDEIVEQDVVKILRNLVRIPTQNPPGKERECAEYIKNKLDEWGIRATLVPKPFNNRPQVVATYGTGKEPILVLNAHMDVVPEGDLKKWDYDPYEGVVENGKLYGRGSCDTKGGLAAAMITAKTLAKNETALKGTLLLQFPVGEEGGQPGTRTLLEEGYLGNWGIVLEPTNLRTATSANGVAWYEISVKGKACHASVPEKGKNAIVKAAKVLTNLEEYGKEIRSRQDPLTGHATCAITKIQGGTKENVVPEMCKITIDRRFLPQESTEQVKLELNELLKGVFGEESKFQYEYESKRSLESAKISSDSKIAKILRNHSKKIADVPDKPFGIIATTDQRNFVNDAGVPAVVWGPGSLDQAHTVDEHVEINQVVKATKILIAVSKELLT